MTKAEELIAIAKQSYYQARECLNRLRKGGEEAEDDDDDDDDDKKDEEEEENEEDDGWSVSDSKSRLASQVVQAVLFGG